MASDYFPDDIQSICEWLENWKIEFAAVASGLGFSAPEVTAVVNDANWALYSCRSASDADSFASAWVEFRERLLYGDPNNPVGSTPGTTTPTAPATPPPLLGVVTRIRSTVKRIKGSPSYTPAMGEALRIQQSSAPVDVDAAKPNLRVKPLPMFGADLRWPRRSFSGVILESLRDGENGWTNLGVKTGSVFVDNRPPLVPNKPEVRQYRTIYVKNDVPVGQWSDVVSATVQP
jgi:hypothetical protein